jgi:hypothetical protein
MRVNNIIKAGVKETPVFILFFYYLFVTLDVFTTYIASPDLMYESNWVIRFFKLDFTQIIIASSIGVLLITFGLLISLCYFHEFYKSGKHDNNYFLSEIFQSRKLIICLLIMSSFYVHLFYSVFVSASNYLQYLILFKIENKLSLVASWYINKVLMRYQYYFFWVQVFFIIAGILFTIYRIRCIRDRYQKVSVSI